MFFNLFFLNIVNRSFNTKENNSETKIKLFYNAAPSLKYFPNVKHNRNFLISWGFCCVFYSYCILNKKKIFNIHYYNIYYIIFLCLQAQFALNTATILLDYYDEFFQTPYPLEKQGLSLNDVMQIIGIAIQSTWKL